MRTTGVGRRRSAAGAAARPRRPSRRLEFEADLLRGEWSETVAALLRSAEISQKELARRLEVSEARVSRLLSGRENATLATIAEIGTAIGVRFSMVAIPFDDRTGTPAQADPPPPRWLSSMRRRLATTAEAAGPPPRA
jgi:transcriptional regulator with XRE-family HTH domain